MKQLWFQTSTNRQELNNRRREREREREREARKRNTPHSISAKLGLLLRSRFRPTMSTTKKRLRNSKKMTMAFKNFGVFESKTQEKGRVRNIERTNNNESKGRKA